MMQAKVLGGDKFRSVLNNIKTAQSTSRTYGFYSQSTYPDGTPVAQVAFWNEYGTDKMPERPFFRNANNMLYGKISAVFKGDMADTKGAIASDKQLEKLGNLAVNTLQESITGIGYSYEPNAPRTVAKKKSSKPLIDTGRMRQSVSFNIENS